MRQDNVHNTEFYLSLITDAEGDLSDSDVETHRPTLTPSLVVFRRRRSSGVMTTDTAATTHSRPDSSLSRYVSATMLPVSSIYYIIIINNNIVHIYISLAGLREVVVYPES